FFFSSRRRHTRCYRDWSSDVCSSDLEEVQECEDIGPVVAQSIHDFFRNPRNQAVIEKLRKAGVKMKEKAAPKARATGPFAGKTRSEERRVGKGGRSSGRE